MPLKAIKTPDLGAVPTASDVIANHIRDAIVSGVLEENDPIRQDDVAKLFNVSKIPVREALKRLEAEGLVLFQRNKGAVVTSMSDTELAQIFEIRAMLESNAIRLAVPHMTPETFARAEAICDEFQTESNVGRWAELNWSFHSSLYQDANRPYLMNLIRSVNDRIERYIRLQLTLSHGEKTADLEHRAILDACKAGDGELASRLLSEHIVAAWQSLLASLPKQGR
ncbi:GntR family transcriptional regulator [Devosia lacusdianchii]|uniref:GntR family transcriptional regulator n=1 Tax=Devosia lacusdianchii TaxID=2917991 RepID=UPI001F0635DE|nr:GntR family transcriptional regulator [Devosia sp. JXJ CY 41]